MSNENNTLSKLFDSAIAAQYAADDARKEADKALVALNAADSARDDANSAWMNAMDSSLSSDRGDLAEVRCARAGISLQEARYGLRWARRMGSTDELDVACQVVTAAEEEHAAAWKELNGEIS